MVMPLGAARSDDRRRLQWHRSARTALWLSGLVFAASTAGAVSFGGQIDWQTYQHAVERLLSGQPIYAPAQVAGPYHLADMVSIGYAYPPPSVPLMIPFAFGDFGRLLWLALGVAVFLGGMWLLTRRFGSLRMGPWPYVLLLLTLTVFGPYDDAVWTGNSDLLWAGVFALMVAAPGSWGGSIAGLAGIARTTPGLAVALDLREAGWRRLGLSCVGRRHPRRRDTTGGRTTVLDGLRCEPVGGHAEL